MIIDLKELSLLGAIFRELQKGGHISRRDAELYGQLSNQQDSYKALFKAQGFELACDSRGFYYFVPEQMGTQVNKTAQRLALFSFILIEHLADQSRDPLSVLDGGSLGRDELPALFDKYSELLAQAEVLSVDDLDEKIMRRLVQLGFAYEGQGLYHFLTPMHRFLDVCLMVQSDRALAASLHSVLPLSETEQASGDTGNAYDNLHDSDAGNSSGDEINDPDDFDEQAALEQAIAEERALKEQP